MSLEYAASTPLFDVCEERFNGSMPPDESLPFFMAGLTLAEAGTALNALKTSADPDKTHLDDVFRLHRGSPRDAACDKVEAILDVVAKSIHKEVAVSKRAVYCYFYYITF